MAKIIVVDEVRCLGCKSCVIQCALAHSQAGTLVEALGADPPPQARVYVEPAEQYGTPLQCRHCEDAPCVAVCPTEALSRSGEGQPVLLDAERCIGCKCCIFICPFGVIEMSRDGRAAVKCDLCAERTAAGLEPACVTACPTGALKFVDLSDELKRRRREVAEKVRLVQADETANR